MQKIRPDLDIGGNIQQMRYQNKLTQDQVIARLNLMESRSPKHLRKAGNKPYEHQSQ